MQCYAANILLFCTILDCVCFIDTLCDIVTLSSWKCICCVPLFLSTVVSAFCFQSCLSVIVLCPKGETGSCLAFAQGQGITGWACKKNIQFILNVEAFLMTVFAHLAHIVKSQLHQAKG
jgi:hypothetical protein